jgi:valyl-tRNA synthetase
MEKTYSPQAIETRHYETWETENYFAPSNKNTPSYCIMLPPPNVTGSLHMGHGFQDTLMDALIRYHRMLGNNTLWQAGTDHAGIATQMVVERQLMAEGKTRHELGREAFVERVWEWKHTTGNKIATQLRRLGTSIDWSRECFMMDPHISKAVQEVFIQLYEEGLIYRGKRLVNWDPAFLTAISDLEVITKEEAGLIWHIRYPIEGSEDFITVATTRPETLFGDVALAVHPEDVRFQSLIGKTVILPLMNRPIPIIADAFVLPEFGTGCVKITPAHDFNDYAVGQRHQLIPINIFTPDIRLNENVPQAYRDLTHEKARQKVLEDLEALGLLVKSEPYQLTIPRGDRSGAIIEPYLTDQWFIKVGPLAEPAIEAVASGKIRFVPENWSKTYFQWMHNIEDWCISRQLWWGHRIPAWYDQNGTLYVAESEAEVRKKFSISKDILLKQEEDVLDTWFSAALWPFATLGWPAKTPELSTFYPTQVLVTGFDIIFFWVARMIMMGLKFMGKIPFETVYITGLIKDSDGQKMSKSKGNVLDPIDLIDGIDLEALVKKRTEGLLQPDMAEKIAAFTRKEFPSGIPAFGTDALRFTYCALASTGRDIRFDLKRVEGYRNFCNKLWNAARYVLITTENHAIVETNVEFSIADQWIQNLLHQTIQAVTEHFKNYRFDLLANTLYEFIWNEFCDWYLEFSKAILNHPNTTEAEKSGTRLTLLTTLESTLRLAHPIIPFITEEIWQRIAPLLEKHGKTILLEPYPEPQTKAINNKIIHQINFVKGIVLTIRNLRSEFNILPNKPIRAIFYANANDKHLIEESAILIKSISKLSQIEWGNNKAEIPTSASGVFGDLEIFIPMENLIDKKIEFERLNKEITKIKKDISISENKLNNEDYVNKAPPEVVKNARDKLEKSKKTLELLERQITSFSTG